MMRALVTGGGGFLGSHIALRLLSEGHSVAVFGRRSYPNLPKEIEQIQGDLSNPDNVYHAVKNQDTVFHVGALTGIWGLPEDFERINIQGTQNILDACKKHGVKKLIYSSSPSVVHSEKDLEGVDETTPYPDTYLCDYPRTKAEAERRVLTANGNGLATVALRPHLIWGPGDPHLVPRIVDRAAQGRLIRVGNGQNKVDITYIDNAVEGHLLAAKALDDPSSSASGKCYFLSDGEPVLLWDWINRVLKEVGIAPVTRSISLGTATMIGKILEGGHRLLGIKSEPRMTPFLASQLATSHYFDISKARQDFGYAPAISKDEAWRRLIDWLKVRQTG